MKNHTSPKNALKYFKYPAQNLWNCFGRYVYKLFSISFFMINNSKVIIAGDNMDLIRSIWTELEISISKKGFELMLLGEEFPCPTVNNMLKSFVDMYYIRDLSSPIIWAPLSVCKYDFFNELNNVEFGGNKGLLYASVDGDYDHLIASSDVDYNLIKDDGLVGFLDKLVLK